MSVLTRRPPFGLASIALLAVAASGPSHGALPAPPHVVGIDTAGSETAAFALPTAPLRVPVTQVRLRFDQALGGLLDTGAFRLLEAGGDGRLDTADCGAAVGDDVAVALAEVHWNGASNEVALRAARDSGLVRGHYRVLACDTLTGLGGLALDGNDDGLPGGVALRDFAIDETPLLANPGFDQDLDGWTLQALPGAGGGLVHDAALDADGAPASGALRVVGNGLGGVWLRSATCIDLSAATGFSPTPRWRLRLAWRVLQGSVRVLPTVWSGFTGDAGETGCDGPGQWQTLDFTATPQPGFTPYESGWRESLPFPLADLDILVVPLDGRPFEIAFDDIGLSFDSRVIFRDDFEP